MRIALLLLLLIAPTALGQAPFHETARQVNARLVKIYGASGVPGIAAYGCGIVVSPKGYILTIATPMLDTSDLAVHLADGRRLKAIVVVTESALDMALLKIVPAEGETLDLPFFDLAQAAKRSAPIPGTMVLAFSNQFKIATREEPLTMQRAVIATIAKLAGRRGIFEPPYNGEVYFLDAVTNNPGAAGGAVTTRTGELLGLIGREVRNTATDTWINYAMPLTASFERKLDDGKTETVSIVRFVDDGIRGIYKATKKENKTQGEGGYTGIVFVPKVIDRTPAYVEAVEPGSPAAKAGLRPDDLIAYVDGEPLASVQAFEDMLKTAQPGVTVYKLEVRRGDRLITIDLPVDNMPRR